LIQKVIDPLVAVPEDAYRGLSMKTLISVVTCFAAIAWSYQAQAKPDDSSVEKGIRALTEIKNGTGNYKLDPSSVPKWLGGTKDASSNLSLVPWCLQDEEEFETIRRDVLSSWETAWIARDAAKFAELVSSDFKVQPLGFVTKDKSQSGGIELSRRSLKQQSSLASGNLAAREIETFLNQFKKIEDVEISGYRILSPRVARDQSMRMNEATVLARFDVRGFNSSGNRLEQRGQFQVRLKKTPAWKISQVEILEQEKLLASRPPTFEEVTQASKIDDNVKTYLRREAIRRGGYALAVGDVNGDKNVDLLVGSAGPSVLLLGNGNGGFSKANIEGLENETLVKAAAIADFDNDGQQDLLFVRFVPEKLANQNRNDVILYRGLAGGKFSKIEPVKDPAKTDHAMPLAVADFNNDGLLDFYVGFPGIKDFTFTQDLYKDPALKVQGVFMNQKGLSFQAKNIPGSGMENWDRYTTSQRLFPHSAVAVDFDRDGFVDLAVVDDRGNLTPIYRNIGGKGFEAANESTNIGNYGYGMGAATGDLFGEGRIDFVMSNVEFTASTRIRDSCRANWLQGFREPAPGLRLFKAVSGGKYVDYSDVTDLKWSGEGMSGVEIVDYNLDGRPDIIATNGLWSGTSRRQDLSSLFARSPQASSRALELATPLSGSQFMDVLINFKGDVQTAKAGEERPSMGGYQHKRLYRNEGGGRFTEVGFMEGIDSVADGYVVARADLFNTGRPDLILRNGDPGSEDVKFPPVQIFRNKNPENNTALKITLTGTRSNVDGIGAEVEVKLAKRTLLQQLIANNGAAQSEKALFFGLGKEKVAKEVAVRWPSGTIQKLYNVKAGVVHITEPAGVQASNQ
jgi:hypothetical protein